MSGWRWLAVLLFVVWMAFALAAYYVAQKPFDPVQVMALADTTDVWLRWSFSGAAVVRSGLDVLTAVWLLFVALGVGLGLLGALRLPDMPDLARFLFAQGLGLGALALLVLALGVVGGLNTAVFLVLLILLTLLTGWPALQFLRQSARPARPHRALGIYVAVLAVLAVLAALLPPHAWDGISYHLKGPQLYLAQGGFYQAADSPHIAPIYFPNLFEMLYLLAMGIRSDAAAQLMHFFLAFLLGGMVFLTARDTLAVRNGWLAIVFLLTMPLTFNLSFIAYNDLSLAFFQLGALVALFQWQKEEAYPWLVLVGIFCGLTMGHKYTTFVTPLALALLLVWGFRGRWRQAIRPFALLTLVTTLVAAPWYLKNVWLTQNPIYPFVFGGVGWDAYLTEAYGHVGSGIGWDPLALLRLPYDLTIGIRDVSGDGQAGAFFLIFLPLLVWAGVRRAGQRQMPLRPLRQLLFFALWQFLFWTLGVINSAGLNQTRQLFATFVVLCPVMAWILEDLARYDHPQFSLKRFVGLVLAFALLLNLVGYVLAWLPKAPYAYALGDDTRDEVGLRLLGGHYAAMQAINELTPADSVVQLLWEPRSYYCARDCRPDVLLYKFTHLEELYGRAAQIAQAWQEAGITHVLVFEAGYDFAVENEMTFIAPQDTAVMETLRTDWLEPVWGLPDGYTLYALRFGN